MDGAGASTTRRGHGKTLCRTAPLDLNNHTDFCSPLTQIVSHKSPDRTPNDFTPRSPTVATVTTPAGVRPVTGRPGDPPPSPTNGQSRAVSAATGRQGGSNQLSLIMARERR